MDRFNFYGLAIIAILLIPNIIYGIKHRGDEVWSYKNKLVEILEGLGRFGCIIFMLYNGTSKYLNFWFKSGLTVYLSVNGGLCALYLIFWGVCWNRNDLLKALSLSIIPSLIFLFSGIAISNVCLIIFSLFFAVSHIFISCKNITDNDSNKKIIIPPWSEIVSEMFDKGLPDENVIDVIYSFDKGRRFVITKSKNNFLTYYLEVLTVFDEEELYYLNKDQYPAMWTPIYLGFKPIYADYETLIKELKLTPEYKTYFD